jgi:hypothetical protein
VRLIFKATNKAIMRKIHLTLLIFSWLLTGASAYSQLNLALPFPNGLKSTAEKVLNSYKDQYTGIRGDTISLTSEVEVYASSVKPDGAMECTLTYYKQTQEATCTWEALMMRTEDFAVASRKYNACYNQLKSIALRTGGHNYKFESAYQSTDQNKSFYSTIFTPVTDDDAYRKLRVEILLENDMVEWTVRILVYEKDHEDTDGSMGLRK